MIKFASSPQANQRPFNSDYNSILASYQATDSQYFPDALTEDMRLLYNVTCTGCNIDALLNDLGALPEVTIVVGPENLILLNSSDCGTCDDPEPYNDPLHYNGNGIGPSNTQWQIESIGAPCAWTMTDNSLPPIKIGMIDTEIDLDHEDLIGNVSSPWSDSGHEVINSHGTQVAGAIVSHINNEKGIAGVCDVCEVDVFQVLHSYDEDRGLGTVSPSSITRAFTEALRANYKVINFSFTISADYLKFVSQEANARGTVLVTGSGNGYNNNNNPPTNLGSAGANSPVSEETPGIIVVGSSWAGSNPTGTPGETIYGFDDGDNQSGWGHTYSQYVDVIAPGGSGDIYRPHNPDDTKRDGLYGIGGGTSFAAPLVAGAAGMLLHKYSCLSPRLVEDLIESSACTDIGNFKPNRYGGGRLDIPAALQAAEDLITDYQNITYINEPTTLSDEELYFNNDIVVRDGGFLVVENSTLHFSPGYGLVIESGGGLYGSNSTFTYNGCSSSETWNGITMDGDDFNSGLVANRPSASLLGCKVINARIGIADHGQSRYYVTNGGIFTADFSEFINCQIGVSSFRPAVSETQIIGSTFTLDDNYPYDGADPRGISLSDSPAGVVIDISSCEFTDKRADREQGFTGLSAQNASFRVDDFIGPDGTNFGATKFDGLLHGVRAWEGSLQNHLASIRNAESVNTNVSAWLIGYNSPLVVNNEFQAQSAYVYTDRFGDPIPAQGIRMEFCRRHVVEGNEIFGGRTALGETYGIVVIGDQLSATRDAVYNNTLNDCNFGMWSEGSNAGVDDISGLCYECNTFNGCERDIETQQNATLSVRQQGLENRQPASAGNVFGSNLMQFASRGNNVDYYSVTPSEQPRPEFQVQPMFINVSNSCLPIFGLTPPEPPCEDYEVVELYDELETLHAYFTDGTVASEAATAALSRYNQRYTRFARALIDPSDDCNENTIEQWEQVSSTHAPWTPVDKSLIDVYQGNTADAINHLNDLAPGISSTEISRLAELLTLRENLLSAATEDEARAAIDNSSLLDQVGESELAQTCGQALSRASAATLELDVAYEARLSQAPPIDQEDSQDDSQAALIIAPSTTVYNATIVDVMGRVIYRNNSGAATTWLGINQLLQQEAAGVYFVKYLDRDGHSFTSAIVHAR